MSSKRQRNYYKEYNSCSARQKRRRKAEVTCNEEISVELVDETLLSNVSSVPMKAEVSQTEDCPSLVIEETSALADLEVLDVLNATLISCTSEQQLGYTSTAENILGCEGGLEQQLGNTSTAQNISGCEGGPLVFDIINSSFGAEELQGRCSTPTAIQLPPRQMTKEPSLLEFTITSQGEESSCNVSKTSKQLPVHPSRPLDQDHLSSQGQSEERVFDFFEFKEKLRTWSLKLKVTLEQSTGLLKFLKTVPGLENLPGDARTLRRTPRKVEQEYVAGGTYSHLGLKEGLQHAYSKNVFTKEDKKLKLLIGIDGFPASKSSLAELWPIMCAIMSEDPSEENYVFDAGIWYGHGKPDCPSAFLKKFIEDACLVVKDGVLIDNVLFEVEIIGITMDTVAKAFILGIKSHSGYYPCLRCKIKGRKKNGLMYFPYTERGAKRTHNEFVEDNALRPLVKPSVSDPNAHQNAYTNLVEIPNFNIIKRTIFDSMHGACAGVKEQLLQIWCGGAKDKNAKAYLRRNRLSVTQIASINRRLERLRAYKPCEFPRKPRNITLYCHFKATEDRQFMTYYGPVAYRKRLSAEQYDHFLLLHQGMTIAYSPIYSRTMVKQAKSAFHKFVSQMKSIYGKRRMTYNIHTLLHLHEDIRRFGPLNNVSAFQMENRLFKISRLIRGFSLPLPQLVKRVCEHNLLPENLAKERKPPTYSKQHSNGPDFQGCEGAQYSRICFHSFTLKVPATNAKDSCFKTTDGTIAVMRNVMYSSKYEEMVVIGSKAAKKESFYETEELSSSDLGIFKIRGFKNRLTIWPVSEVKEKLMILPGNKKETYFVVFPIQHTSKD